MTNKPSEEAADKGIDRRGAIKRGIAAGAVAGVVWSAPKVEGLTLRPNYASAQSGTGDQTIINIPATDITNATSETFDICSGTGSIQIRTRKDFINNPRNISIQFNPFSSMAADGAADQATIDPSAILPGALGGAMTNANGYTFTGVLTSNGAFSLTIPYTCA